MAVAVTGTLALSGAESTRTATHLLLLPSPFLGPEAYGPLVPALEATGLGAAVAPTTEPPAPLTLVETWAEEASRHPDVVLLPHSNAGLLAAGVAALVGAPVVFMDAALPLAAGRTPLVPPQLLSFLEGLARPDGRLPRWTRWWEREDIEQTLPGSWFEHVDSLVPEVPWSYAQAEVPVPAGWERGRRAYLAFGSTYAEEVATATRLGWPVRTLAGGHLHCVIEPEATAAALVSLLAGLGLHHTYDRGR